MLTNRDIENLLDADEPDSLEMEYWPVSLEATPGAECWKATNDQCVIHYIPGTDDPALSIGYRVQGDWVHSIAPSIDDIEAAEILRMTPVAPLDAIAQLGDLKGAEKNRVYRMQ